MYLDVIFFLILASQGQSVFSVMGCDSVKFSRVVVLSLYKKVDNCLL